MLGVFLPSSYYVTKKIKDAERKAVKSGNLLDTCRHLNRESSWASIHEKLSNSIILTNTFMSDFFCFFFFLSVLTDMSSGSQISKFNEMPLETESCCLSLSVKTQYFKSYILTTLSLLKGKERLCMCLCVYEGVFIHKCIYLVMIFICFLSS